NFPVFGAIEDIEPKNTLLSSKICNFQTYSPGIFELYISSQVIPPSIVFNMQAPLEFLPAAYPIVSEVNKISTNAVAYSDISVYSQVEPESVDFIIKAGEKYAPQP